MNKKRIVIATLGIDDVGDGEGPWIPDSVELQEVADTLARAFQTDNNDKVEVVVYHHGLNVQMFEVDN